ncbi:hypothetical protein PF049_06330 [Erythrobacteraceae bacterium WH01K]|nr:hypothetical protein PF049_06330 [Erythrobacteraceae bacterium WH01K]
MLQFIKCHAWPIATFFIIAAAGYFARSAIGTVYSAAEAIALLDALSRAGLYLASAIAGGSTTILALMLTLIGMIRRMDHDFSDQAYRDVDLIARLATASLLGSLFLLLAFVFPVGEFEDLPRQWFETLYEALFIGTVTVIGLAGATVVLMYITLRRVIAHITPGDAV